MAAEREIVILAAVDQVWPLLTDAAVLADCVPGVTVAAAVGDRVAGRCRTRVGAHSVTYRGELRIARADAATRTVVVELSGVAARDGSSARVLAEASVSPYPGGTRVLLRASATVDGRAAGFGDGSLAATAERMLDRFAIRLRERLATVEQVEVARVPDPPNGAGRLAPLEPLDLFGPARRGPRWGLLVPVAVLAVATALLLRRRSRR